MDGTRRSIEIRSADLRPRTVICASRLPPPLTPIPGGDTPAITSPTPISIEVRQPTILNSEDYSDEGYENDSTGHLVVDNNVLGRSRPISRSNDFVGYHEEPQPIQVFVPPNRDEFADSPVTPLRPNSRPSSRYSYRPTSQHGGYHVGGRPWSQYSHNLPSEYSFRSPQHLNGAEAAARGYLSVAPSHRTSSPAPSVRALSIAGSTTSRIYRASRPTTRVRRPSPMGNAPRRVDRSPAPVSARQSVHEVPQDVPIVDPPQPESQTTGSYRHGRNSVTFGPSPTSLPDGVLRPMIGIDRYEKHKLITVEEAERDHVCPPLTTQFTRESPPEDWTPLMHPEGALYWIHNKNPIYTDTNMCDPNLRKRIEDALDEMEKLKEMSPLPVDDWELALELGEDGETGEPICSYYFVCHSTRCLFWFHEFDPERIIGNLRGITEDTHIHLALQTQYWNHWEMYPHNREVPEHLIQELLGILVHAGVDCMTSANSTAPYSEAEFWKLLGYVKHVRSVGGNYGFSACVVGRLMSFFLYSRYLNFYGQKGARLTNDQTIYGFQPKRTYLIRTLSIFFFYAPELHLRGLESVYTDFVLCQHRWALYITRLRNDWTEFILYGTVLLNANVAFLAIPSVDPGNHTRTPAQLASYLSIITSVGSVVIGLLLLRQHRTKPEDSSDEVDHYLRSRRHNALGFETLAILYSLPYSLLLWSTMAFTTAFSLETLVFSSQLWAKLSVGVVLAMMILLISWCIWTTMEGRKDISVFGSVHHLKDRLVEFTRGLRGKKCGSDAGDGESGGGQDVRGKTRRSGTLKEALSLFRRRRGVSVTSTLVGANPIVSNGTCRPSDCTGIQMGEVNQKEPGSAV